MKTNIHKEIFSQNLNYYLKKKGYNQSDLLKAINVSKSTMSTWCRGTRLPRMHHIQALADYLNIEKSMLIEDMNIENKENKDISSIINNIENLLENNKDIILKGEPLNQDIATLLISYIQEGLELIKKENK